MPAAPTPCRFYFPSPIGRVGIVGVKSADLFGRVDPMNRKHVLGDIRADQSNLHVDGYPHVIRLRQNTYGTSMPGVGAVRHIKTGREQPQQILEANSWNRVRGYRVHPCRSRSMLYPISAETCA